MIVVVVVKGHAGVPRVILSAPLNVVPSVIKAHILHLFLLQRKAPGVLG